MCGIAVVVSGVKISFTSVTPLPLLSNLPSPSIAPSITLEDLKFALSRRGPDNLGFKVIRVPSVPCSFGNQQIELESSDCAAKAEICFIGATLQLRGLNPIAQPFYDSSGNVLVYNGEVFGGFLVDNHCNDGEILVRALGSCCSCGGSGPDSGHGVSCSGDRKSIKEVLSMIKGPWSFIFWQEFSKTLWFGRDAFGRRSLLVHWPSKEDSRFLLSSQSPITSGNQISGPDTETITSFRFWDELQCGIYSLQLTVAENITGTVKKHDWVDSMLLELVDWKRKHVEPNTEDLIVAEKASRSFLVDHLLHALKKSVMLRTPSNTTFQESKFDGCLEDFVPVAVLFSGGLDSMILAVLLDECLNPSYAIDLLNVSFDNELAPDRISAKAGVQELQRIAPLRRWRLVEIDATLSDLSMDILHVQSLIDPANTYMDLNIGIALWLAARGDGWIHQDKVGNKDGCCERIRYKSEAKIVVVGSGADEQCAGYSRYRTRYRKSSWVGLNEEMRLDMQRIWKRNMGRDDRCIADNGKEARFPFLDEDVMHTLLEMPLWEIADLDQPCGIGDKKILREVAMCLGLRDSAVMPKRAIQFGSRIARESNKKNFGSNRAANLASAGSVQVSLHNDFL